MRLSTTSVVLLGMQMTEASQKQSNSHAKEVALPRRGPPRRGPMPTLPSPYEHGLGCRDGLDFAGTYCAKYGSRTFYALCKPRGLSTENALLLCPLYEVKKFSQCPKSYLCRNDGRRIRDWNSVTDSGPPPQIDCIDNRLHPWNRNAGWYKRYKDPEDGDGDGENRERQSTLFDFMGATQAPAKRPRHSSQDTSTWGGDISL